MRWLKLLVDFALLALLVLLTGALPGGQGFAQTSGLVFLVLAVVQMALDLTSLLEATGSLASRLTWQVYLRLTVDALMVLSFWPLAIAGVLVATGAGGMMDTLGAHATLATVAYAVVALHLAQHLFVVCLHVFRWMGNGHAALAKTMLVRLVK